jgi:hypothetical protein
MLTTENMLPLISESRRKGPDCCPDHRDGPGAWSEGGGGYFYFVLFGCLAGGIWLFLRSRHINFPTTIVMIVVVLNSYVH